MVTFERRIRLPRSHALKWLVLATAVLSVAEVVPLERHGLHATYFWVLDRQSGHEQAEVLDNPPSTGAIKRQRPDFAEHPFSVEWRGFLEVRRTGTYRFVIKSDDGAALYIRGKRIRPTIQGATPSSQAQKAKCLSTKLSIRSSSAISRTAKSADSRRCGLATGRAARRGAFVRMARRSTIGHGLTLRRVSNAGWTLISLAWLGCPLVWAGRWTGGTARRHVEFEDRTVNPALGVAWYSSQHC